MREPTMSTAPTPTYPLTLDSDMDRVVLVDHGPEYVGKRYLCRVWDSVAKRYQNKRFAKVAAAKAWAKTTRSDFETRQSSAGKLPLASVVPSFIAHMKAEGRSASHIGDVERLLEGLSKGPRPVDLRSDSAEAIVTQYLAGLTDGRPRKTAAPRKLSPRTYNKLTGYFIALGNWLEERRKVPRNPFALLPRKKQGKTLQPFFTPTEARAMVSDHALAQPHGLLVALSIYTGLRIREALWLRWDHIDWGNSLIHVRLPDAVDRAEAKACKISTDPEVDDKRWKQVKRDKERTARLEPELAAILKPLAQLSGYVFPSKVRETIRHGQTVGRALARHCKRTGVELKDRHWHSLRHSCAAMLRAAGVGPDRIMDALGHESPGLWKRYSEGAKRIELECRGWDGHIRLRNPPKRDASSKSEGTPAETATPAEAPAQ